MYELALSIVINLIRLLLIFLRMLMLYVFQLCDFTRVSVANHTRARAGEPFGVPPVNPLNKYCHYITLINAPEAWKYIDQMAWTDIGFDENAGDYAAHEALDGARILRYTEARNADANRRAFELCDKQPALNSARAVEPRKLTSTLGVIMARQNTGRGFSGLAWKTRAHLYERLESDNIARGEMAAFCHAFAIDIMRLGEMALTGCRVIHRNTIDYNCSNDEYTINAALAPFFRCLLGFGYDILICQSAGDDPLNEPYNLSRFDLCSDPEVDKRVIAVSACNSEGTLRRFSAYSRKTNLLAPGEGSIALGAVYELPEEAESPAKDYYFGDQRSAYTLYARGTFLATACVTSVAAMMLGVNPALSAPQLKRLILENGKQKPVAPMLDAGKAVKAAAEAQGEGYSPDLNAGGVIVYACYKPGGYNSPLDMVPEAEYQVTPLDECAPPLKPEQTALMPVKTGLSKDAPNQTVMLFFMGAPGKYIVDMRAAGYFAQSIEIEICAGHMALYGEVLKLDQRSRADERGDKPDKQLAYSKLYASGEKIARDESAFENRRF